ncbi:nuclease-related domain-containing protein [Cryobacterium tagatosivorans]|uniref:NERD domain-containing protein n=1 Tax=Cryobacterium tagatosivorans TaxID=1259199 RepID=A0A4R8UAE9_9MICO|nr:nuclease-related domain-containing protein [Cryobacterium tagatosivorans]TFB47002.1 NERD domain-containing protein [Cryobacterium tagatosivorans]
MATNADTMRDRFAAQAVIEELLRVQGNVPRRSTLGRLFGLSPLGADSVPWYLGAKGERAVGSLLESLPPEWAVFHALPVGVKGSDIDHVLVGPPGIFTINTKHHRGQTVWVAGRNLLVSGRKTRYIRDAELEAERVTELVRRRMPRSAPARPVVAFVGPKQLTIREKPASVTIVDARHLRRWLLSLPPTLAWPERMEITAVVDNPATWRRPPVAVPGPLVSPVRSSPPPSGRTGAPGPTSSSSSSSSSSSPSQLPSYRASAAPAPADDPIARFAALDADVRAARRRRLLWVLLALATTTAGAFLAAPPLTTLLLGSGR